MPCSCAMGTAAGSVVATAAPSNRQAVSAKGVTAQTAPLVAAAGADVLVAGSAVFKGGPAHYAAHIEAIRVAADSARGTMV